MTSQGQYRYTISQVKKMERLLQKEIPQILEKIGQDTANKLKVYVRQYWYSRYTPEDYQRTYSFLESITYKVEDYSVEIYFDSNKFDHIINHNGWGAHVGFDGNDFNDGLVQFIETGSFDSGKVGSTHNPRIGNHSGAIEKTKKWLDKYLGEEVKRQISSRLNVTVN